MLFIKNRLRKFNNSGYINLALAKSSVRIETLNYSTATHDALSVFFCVNTCARLFIKSFSMVALVGHPKGWLDSVGASSLNPANVTANEIETSSGDYNNQPTEAVIMTTTLSPIVSTQKTPKSYDLTTELEDPQSIMSSSINLYRRNQFVSNTHVNIRG